MRASRLTTIPLLCAALLLPAAAGANGASVTTEVVDDEACVTDASGTTTCFDLNGVFTTVVTPAGVWIQSVTGDFVVTKTDASGATFSSEDQSLHLKMVSGPDGVIVQSEASCVVLDLDGDVFVTDIRLHVVQGEVRILDFGTVCP